MVGIKGWEMPNSCRECRCKDWLLDTNGTRRYYCMANGRAKFLEFYKELNNPRPDFCPLVEVPDWHNVNYLLPSFGEEVLIYDDDIGITLGWLCSNGEWCTEQFILDNVTHWQQIVLPEK